MFDVDLDQRTARNRAAARAQARTSTARTLRTAPNPASSSADLVWPLTVTLFLVCLVMAAACVRRDRNLWGRYR